MRRRDFLRCSLVIVADLMAPTGRSRGAAVGAPEPDTADLDPQQAKDWLTRWQKSILHDRNDRFCDRETGEEIGWLISPYLNGFYYGYRATGDVQWVEQLVDWADAWIQRGVKEPDGYTGWPKANTGGELEKEFFTDSLLGEAMGLRPIVLMAAEIQKKPDLKPRFGIKADTYLKLADEMFEKWVSRGCWRETKEGGVWVVPAFGIDRATGKWTEGYARRDTDGFSNPDNKQNHISRWLIAMFDVTGKPVYRDHAEKWWKVMKSRMRSRDDGKYFVWNYWDPAGPWDYKPDGSTRHWVGVHPNGGYYQLDLEGIVSAFEHGLVFTKADIDKLIATNRDFMWNHQIKGARFKRIDGGEVDARWQQAPGTLWISLVPYDETLRKIFIANHDPASWGGLINTPWYLSLRK